MLAERMAALPPAGTDQGAACARQRTCPWDEAHEPRAAPRDLESGAWRSQLCRLRRAPPWPGQNTQLVVHLKSPYPRALHWEYTRTQSQTAVGNTSYHPELPRRREASRVPGGGQGPAPSWSFLGQAQGRGSPKETAHLRENSHSSRPTGGLLWDE